jgi:hypothetical protein
MSRLDMCGGRSIARCWICAGFLTLGITLYAQRVADAQPYCAVYDAGTQNCGIPTLESCQQSVSGVGGICEPDNTSQERPDLFNRRGLLRTLEGQSPPPAQATNPNDPNWMPPPPDQ